MLRFFLQTITPTLTPLPTVTPTATTDFLTYAQGVFMSLLGIDIMIVLKGIALWIVLIWLVFAFWVAIDAIQRYRNFFVPLLWFLFVLPFNIFGFIGYLFIRPGLTLEEKEWTKLEGKYLMYELSSVNDCPTCQTMIPLENKYCPVCGTAMTRTCTKCGATQSIFSAYCISCGVMLKQNPVTMAAEPKASSQLWTPRVKKSKQSAVEPVPVVVDPTIIEMNTNEKQSGKRFSLDSLNAVKAKFAQSVSKAQESIRALIKKKPRTESVS